jgi:hypothetical protein
MAATYPPPHPASRTAALIGCLPKLKNKSSDEKLAIHAHLGEILRSQPEAPWYPQSGPQALAYLSTADELFFGGSAGGGKSDLIIGLGMTAHLSSLVVRLEATQLTGFKERVKQLMMGGDRWQGVGPHGGILRTHDGRTMEFSGCDSFQAANSKFRGRPHDLKAFDELPTLPQQVYEFIIGWNRTHVPGQRCRVVAAGNPPARPEEEWVLDYWAPWVKDFTAEPGEVRWFARIDGKSVAVEDNTPINYKGETIYPRSRSFIPARLEDNPILESTGYRQTLQNMPEPYRSQLLYGDMKIGLSDDAHQLIPTDWIQQAIERGRRAPGHGPNLTSVGVDPSRGGKDRSVIAKRYDNVIAPLIVIPGKDVREGPALAAKILMNVEWVFAPIIIDITGTAGGGVYDSLRLMQSNIFAYPFVAANKSEYQDRSGRIKMRNKRTEAYWRLRDWLDPVNNTGAILPDDDELRVELAAHRWYMYPSGAGLEEKEDVMARLPNNRSPDKADAVAMCMMEGDAMSGWIPEDRNPTVNRDRFMGAENPGTVHKEQPADTGGWV